MSGYTSPYGRVPPNRRPQPVARSVNPWGLAVVTFLIGTGVVLVLGFVLGLVGVLLVGGATLGGADLSDDSLVATAALVAVVPLVVSVAVQALWIHRRGGSNHLFAPIAATAAGWLLGAALSPFALSDTVLIVLNAVTQIGVLGWLVGLGAGAGTRGPVRR